MIDQADVLERLRRVQELLEGLRDKDAEFSERLLRHEYETAQEHVSLGKRIDEIHGPQGTQSLFSELASSRYGQLLIVSACVALLAWAGVPVKRLLDLAPPAISQDSQEKDD